MDDLGPKMTSKWCPEGCPEGHFSRKANIESVRAGSIQTPFGPLREGPPNPLFFGFVRGAHFWKYFSLFLSFVSHLLAHVTFRAPHWLPIGTHFEHIFNEKSGSVAIGTANGIHNPRNYTKTTSKVPKVLGIILKSTISSCSSKT